MRRFKPHVDAHGLTLPQWRVIRALADSGPLDQAALADRCAILAPSLTRIFRALEERGLIEPAPAADARRRVVRLTEAGRALYDEMAGTSEAIYRDLEQAFGEERMALLLDLLTDLRTVAERLEDAAPSAGAAAD